jgi:hypothetical protein
MFAIIGFLEHIYHIIRQPFSLGIVEIEVRTFVSCKGFSLLLMVIRESKELLHKLPTL